MTVLYVANSTKQRYLFTYRIPDEAGCRTQYIEIGNQIKIDEAGLDTRKVDAIIAQHRPYGMIAHDEVSRHRGFAGLCYSIDKPVNSVLIERVIHSNTEVLKDQGVEIRKAAGLAASAKLEQDMNNLKETFRDKFDPGSLTSTELSIEEDPASDRPDTDINERITVSRDEARNVEQKPARGGRRGRR